VIEQLQYMVSLGFYQELYTYDDMHNISSTLDKYSAGASGGGPGGLTPLNKICPP